MFSTTQMSHTVRVHLWGEGFSGFLALSAVGSSKCWGWWGVVELGPAGPPAHSIILSASQSGSVCAPLPPATPGPCKNNPLRKGRAPSFIEVGGQAHPHRVYMHCANRARNKTSGTWTYALGCECSENQFKKDIKNICQFFCSLTLFAFIDSNFTLWHVSLELCVRAG